MGPRYLIFVSEPAQGNDSYRYGENEPPGLCVISAPRLKVPAQGPRKTGWPRPWSIMTGAFLRSGTPPSKVKCQGPVIRWCPCCSMKQSPAPNASSATAI